VGSAQSSPASTFAQYSPALSQPRSINTSDDNEKAMTFVGRIALADGKYVLKDGAGKATYHLDDQEKAKQFDGQNVKVTGTLDESNNTIHVVEIQAA
jgi:uncharacterized protein YdeI (BOF family)